MTAIASAPHPSTRIEARAMGAPPTLADRAPKAVKDSNDTADTPAIMNLSWSS